MDFLQFVRRKLPVMALASVLAGVLCLGVQAQGSMGPELPPGFYGERPPPFIGPEAPEGIRRLAVVYTGSILGETDPCG